MILEAGLYRLIEIIQSACRANTHQVSDQTVEFSILPLPRMMCKAPQGSSKLWVDTETTKMVPRLRPQKDLNPWTGSRRLSPLRNQEV